MGYSVMWLGLACGLGCLGFGIAYYLLRVCLEFLADRAGRRKTEPDYIRDINRKLRLNNVETERDLL